MLRSHCNKSGCETGGVIGFDALNYHALLAWADSASPRLGTQKDAVKRLCRGGDTLLSRPGRGAALRLADRRYSWRNPVRGRAIKTAKDQVSGTFMPQKVRIALDAMGGDVGASVVIPGAATALTRRPDSEFLLYGDSALIEAQLAKYPALK